MADNQQGQANNSRQEHSSMDDDRKRNVFGYGGQNPVPQGSGDNARRAGRGGSGKEPQSAPAPGRDRP